MVGAHLEGPFLGGKPGAHDRASMQGIELRVGSASDALDKVLTMTGLDELLVRR